MSIFFCRWFSLFFCAKSNNTFFKLWNIMIISCPTSSILSSHNMSEVVIQMAEMIEVWILALALCLPRFYYIQLHKHELCVLDVVVRYLVPMPIYAFRTAALINLFIQFVSSSPLLFPPGGKGTSGHDATIIQICSADNPLGYWVE